MTIDRGRQLAKCNRQLVLDINKKFRQIAITELAIEILVALELGGETRETLDAWKRDDSPYPTSAMT